MIKAVIFDLDDTLYPEYDYVKSGFMRVAEYIESKYKFTDVFQLLLQLFEEDKKDVFGRALERLQTKNNQVEIDVMVNLYRQNIPEKLSLFKDAAITIKTLKEKKFKLGIITDGRVDGQNNKINALKIKAYFDAIIITDELGGESFRKPHPKAFVTIAEKLGVELSDILYVGDNPKKDFAVTEHLPIKTAQILRDKSLHNQKCYYKNIMPTFTIKKLYEILDIVYEEI